MAVEVLVYDVPDGEDAKTLGRKILSIWRDSTANLQEAMTRNGSPNDLASRVSIDQPFELRETGGGVGLESIGILVSMAPLVHALTPLLQPG